jgi:hypothetical protein
MAAPAPLPNPSLTAALAHPQPASSTPRHLQPCPTPPRARAARTAVDRCRSPRPRARHPGPSTCTRASPPQRATETSLHPAVSRHCPERETTPLRRLRHRVRIGSRTRLTRRSVPAHRARTRLAPARIHAKRAQALHLALASATGTPCAPLWPRTNTCGRRHWLDAC